MLKDVFVRACGRGVFPGLGIYGHGPWILAREVGHSEGWIGPQSCSFGVTAAHPFALFGPAEFYDSTLTPVS